MSQINNNIDPDSRDYDLKSIEPDERFTQTTKEFWITLGTYLVFMVLMIANLYLVGGMIFTAVQSRCFKTAIRRCSLPISVLSRRFASFPASSRIDSADFVYLLFSAPKVPPANGIWLKILMIDCIVTPFSCKTTNGAVSLTKVSAISRCSLPI